MEAICVLWEVPCKHNAFLIWAVDKDKDGTHDTLNKGDGPPMQDISTKGTLCVHTLTGQP